jgi:hypothetical protein
MRPVPCHNAWRAQGVSQRRRSVAGLLPRRPEFMPGSVHVGFMVDNVTLGQIFLWQLWSSPVNIIPLRLHVHISSGRINTRPVVGRSSETWSQQSIRSKENSPAMRSYCVNSNPLLSISDIIIKLEEHLECARAYQQSVVVHMSKRCS